MNEEQTFQFGPFEVTVHPATNEEDEWVEVVDLPDWLLEGQPQSILERN